jgi:hypothetical protein
MHVETLLEKVHLLFKHVDDMQTSFLGGEQGDSTCCSRCNVQHLLEAGVIECLDQLDTMDQDLKTLRR